MHLPRYIDKLRLSFAGSLPNDYHANLGKGFDGMWLESAGVSADEFIQVVKNSITDGQVCDWVRTHVKVPESAKQQHREQMLNYPDSSDAAMVERLVTRKKEAGMSAREEIRTFVDFIDADEKRR